MGAMTSVSLNAAIEELEHSCLVASMCLLASLPANMEKVLARQAAFLGAVADGLDPVGRTFRAPGGYIQILAEHRGRWQRDLPDGVDAADVIDGLDRDGTPLLDLLRSLIGALRPLVARRDGDPAARTSFDQVPDACSADYDQRLLTAFRETLKPLTGYHAALAAGDKEIGQVYIRTATKAFGELSEMTSQLRDALAMDGQVTAAEMALCDIGCGLAGREPSAAPGADLTPTALLLSRYIDALVRTPAVTAPAYLAEVCFEMVTAGQEKVLREVAHAYSSQARERIRAAVGAPSVQQFQLALFSALPYELGALFIASAARDFVAAAGHAPWAALAGHAEEWAVRMQSSFGLAAQILQDGRIFEAHRRYFDGIRAAEGEQAAQSKAAEFVEQRIYYPRVTLPLLLSAEPIPVRPPLKIDS
jgi:hypothetical protein